MNYTHDPEAVAVVPMPWATGGASVEAGQGPYVVVAEALRSSEMAPGTIVSGSSTTDPLDYRTFSIGEAIEVGRSTRLEIEIADRLVRIAASHFAPSSLVEYSNFVTYYVGTCAALPAERRTRSFWPTLRDQLQYARGLLFAVLTIHDEWKVVTAYEDLVVNLRELQLRTKLPAPHAEILEADAAALDAMSQAQDDVERRYQEQLDEDRVAYSLVRDE